MDTDRAPGMAKDFTCGTRTYDTHNGMDIAVRNLSSAVAGTDVVAAADGTVFQTTDGVPDGVVRTNNIELTSQLPCGNSVMIEHKSGWQTIYCHLKQGSVAVRSGDKVAEGQVIGQVGLSGATSWPHLGFSVSRNGQSIDPYTGRSALEGCGLSARSLWKSPADYPYQPFSIFNLGLDIHAPEEKTLDEGTYEPIAALPTNTPVLTLWGMVFGTREDDRVELIVTDPDGKEFVRFEGTFEDASEKRLIQASRERFNEVWKPGTYSGVIRLIREDGAKDLTTAWSVSINLVQEN